MHRTEGNSQPRSTALSGQQERLKETFTTITTLYTYCLETSLYRL